jgi:hypothetical protein
LPNYTKLGKRKANIFRPKSPPAWRRVDTDRFVPLLDETLGVVRPQRVVADAGYDPTTHGSRFGHTGASLGGV